MLAIAAGVVLGTMSTSVVGPDASANDSVAVGEEATWREKFSERVD